MRISKEAENKEEGNHTPQIDQTQSATQVNNLEGDNTPNKAQTTNSENDSDQSYSNDELLELYKSQQVAERGFRFLKDPLFLLQAYS